MIAAIYEPRKTTYGVSRLFNNMYATVVQRMPLYASIA